MGSFAYLWITSGFCCHPGRRCADTHFWSVPTSHLFKVALAVDGSEFSSRKVSKLSRRCNRLKKKINTMADPPPNAWVCGVCNYENSLDALCCTMCATPRPRGSRSVLIVAKNSTHPAAVAARGSLGSRRPLKARGRRILLLVSLPREVQRIRRMSESPPSWPNASPCLWPRWCNRPRLPLMPHWSPLLLLPVLAQGSLTSLGEIRTMAMIPPLPLRADLGGRRRVWGWGTVVLSSPPKTHRSRRPTTR